MKIKQGQTWQLGKHKLTCGDCVDPKVTETLMGKDKARVIITDPPYGVGYVENKEFFKKKNGENQISVPKIILNDELQSDEQYKNFTRDWLKAIKPHLEDYNASYIFNSDLMICALRTGMKEAGWYYSQMIIWVKQSVVIGRKDYLPQHELCIYGWQKHHKMERVKNKSVIFYPKPNKSKIHPTQKPVGLIRKLILDSTKIHQIVYDAFGGSGSTLIACEHTSRVARIIEIDEHYCNEIIARWEKLTGLKATQI